MLIHSSGSRYSREAIGAAARVTAYGDVVEDSIMRVKDGIDEADSALAGRQPLLVDASQDGAPGGRRGRRASNESRTTGVPDQNIVADCAHWMSSISQGSGMAVEQESYHLGNLFRHGYRCRHSHQC